MKKLIFPVMIAVAAVLSSCSFTRPLTFSEAPMGNKTGKSSTVILFGSWQLNSDFGIGEAAREGGIKGGVATADITFYNYVFFTKKTITVHGK